MRDFFDLQIRVRAHTFYPGRGEFISVDSRFLEWVCIAPESGKFRFATETATEDGTQIGIKDGEAQMGDLIFAAPRALFERHVIAAPLSYHVLQWSFLSENSAVENGAVENGVVENAWRGGKYTVRDVARLQGTLSLLGSLAAENDARAARFRAHLLEDLLHLCLGARDQAPVADALMREAAQLLEFRAGEVMAMSEVARAVKLSSVQLTRRFRAAHGCNPIEFLTRIRLENAQKMLIETPASLDEIAARCGWNSGSYLIHVFQKHLQTTPHRFRALHRV